MSNNETYPGDTLIPSPEMHYNHTITIAAPPSAIFPWIQQLGKARGGWYLPRTWERVLPRVTHAARALNPAWTALEVGDRVPDYGFAQEEWFEVKAVEDGRALVYWSERLGTVFSWAIVLTEVGDGGKVVDLGEERVVETEVRLRFRGRIQRTGWARKVLVWGGGWIDWATTWPMLRGLRERVEEQAERERLRSGAGHVHAD